MIIQVVVLLLVLCLCSVEGMKKRKKNRQQQRGDTLCLLSSHVPLSVWIPDQANPKLSHCLICCTVLSPGKQEAAAGGSGGECTGDELECLRQVLFECLRQFFLPQSTNATHQVIPGKPKEDYPIYAPSFLCKLNPKNPGCPGFGK